MLHERLKQFRCHSVAKAREAGIPAYFLEADGVLRVLPDGSRERIVVSDGRAVAMPLRESGGSLQACG